MSLPLLITPAAEADIREARFWYEAKLAGLSDRLVLCLEAAFDHIKRIPRAGKLVEPGVRRVVVRKFPYGVFYRVESDRIATLRSITTSATRECGSPDTAPESPPRPHHHRPRHPPWEPVHPRVALPRRNDARTPEFGRDRRRHPRRNGFPESLSTLEAVCALAASPDPVWTVQKKSACPTGGGVFPLDSLERGLHVERIQNRSVCDRGERCSRGNHPRPIKS